MLNNAAHHVGQRKKKILDVLRWLKTAFSKLFVFKDSYILLCFFPEIETKIQYFHFYYHW